MSEQEF